MPVPPLPVPPLPVTPRLAEHLLAYDGLRLFAERAAAAAPDFALTERNAAAVARLDRDLSDIVSAMAERGGQEAETLDRLLKISAEIGHLSAQSAFRFGAAGAYEAIVNQRIQVLREERLGGRQLFSEFMMRRFDPAMRTCRSAKDRLEELSEDQGSVYSLINLFSGGALLQLSVFAIGIMPYITSAIIVLGPLTSSAVSLLLPTKG